VWELNFLAVLFQSRVKSSQLSSRWDGLITASVTAGLLEACESSMWGAKMTQR